MQTQSLVGTTIDGKFELLSVAGSGGMGTVFKARQLELERFAAVKILDVELLKDEDSLKRFEREAKSISQLSNEHIASFYACGFWNRFPYIAMEWLDGTSLSALIASEESLNTERCARIAEQIAAALEAVHKEGIIHRDLKPANIILLEQPEADFVKLLDFGLARIVEESGNVEDLTRSGTLIGTPAYFSPEQCRGENADARSDVYALGCIMYEMLAGQPPFQADAPIGVIHKHLNEKVPTLASKLSTPSPQIERIISKCLEKDLQERYQNMSELRDDLVAMLSGIETGSKPSGGLSSEALALRRKVLIARYATGGILVLGLLGFFAYQWSASEAGSVAKTEVLLKNDHSKQTVLECLDLAEKFAVQGKFDLFKRIKKAADVALKLDSVEAKARLKNCLDISADLQKRADNYCAYAYAMQAISTVEEMRGRTAKAQQAAEAHLQIVSLEQASRLVLKSGVIDKKASDNSDLVDHEQFKKMVASTAAALWTEPTTCESSVKLANLFIDKTNMPLSDSVMSCKLANLFFMAQHGRVAELDASIGKTLEVLDKYQGLTKMRLAPQPCAAYFLVSLGIAFQTAKNNAQALRYAQKAEDLLNKVDLSTVDADQKAATAITWCNLSYLYDSLNDKEQSLRCARVASSITPLQDDNSASCYKQLALSLISNGMLAEAEPVARDVYVYFKARSWDGLTMTQRFDSADAFAHVLIELHKDRQAIRILSDEIAEQKKHIPASVMQFAHLNTVLAQYYLKHSQPGRAAESYRRIVEVMPLLKGEERLNYDALLMAHPSDDPKIAKVAVTDALAYIEKSKIAEVKPLLLAAFARMLRYLEPGSELATKCLQNTESGCMSMLDAANEQIEPFALADIINLLGINGAESIADKIRSAAMEKLPPEKAGPFSAYCIDFVASADSQDGTKYSAPDHAVSVFLDLAHDMQNKDNQSAFKYAFEALKIVRVLLASNGALDKSLLEKANDAANLILETKNLPDQYQFDSVIELCTLELNAIKESGKAGLFDLFSACLKKKDYPYTDKIVSGIFVVDDYLASQKQVAALEALANSTKSDIVKFHHSGLLLAEHYSEIAAELDTQAAAAHFFLTQSARLLEELTPEQLSMDPSRVASVWEKNALAASRSGDVNLALTYSRKAMAIRPLQDYSSGQAAHALCQALTAAKKYPEGEKLARDFYSFAVAQKDLSPQALELRYLAVLDLYRLLDVEAKFAEAQNILLQECQWRSRHLSPQALQPAELNITLAFHKLVHESPQSAYPFMMSARKYAASIRSERRVSWYSSALQRHVINIAARANDPATCAAAYNEMIVAAVSNKGDALKYPSSWWSNALLCLKKAGDSKTSAALIDFVKQGFGQVLSEKEPDPNFLGDIVANISSTGDAGTADVLKELAQKKLAETVFAQFISRCNAPAQVPAAPGLETEAKPAADDSSNQGAAGSENEGETKPQ